MEKEEIKNEQQGLSFAAINPFIVTNIVSAKEEEIKGRDYIAWGSQNQYPNYIWQLTQDVTLLRTIINGMSNYVVGENIIINHIPWRDAVNKNGDTVEDIVRNIALDYGRYGGFALNVIRNKMGGIAEIYYLDFKNIRSDKKNEFFFYSEDWYKSYGRVKYNTYPKFRTNGKEYSSIYYFKNSYNTVYPLALFAGDGCLAAETERGINEFHLNSIKNGFSSNVIINFNNGRPTEEMQEEIEKNLNEKFGGFSNAGRMLVAFNDNKDNAVTIQKIDAADFGERYQALSKNCKQEIYSAFQAHPVLFGLPTEGTGFSDQDFNEAFKVFNKTVILPIQKVIKSAFEKILGEKEIISIEPFNIDWSEDGKTEIVK